MVNPFGSNFKPEKPTGQREKLPVGAYVCGIIGVKPESDKLTIQVEIIEGEYTSFFKKDYESQSGSTFGAPKYKGNYVLQFPDNNVSKEINDIRERTAKSAAWAVEQSNPGFKWEWETIERTLKGKQVGIMVREFDWAMQDQNSLEWRTGTGYEIGALVSADDVRSGKCKPMKKRGLSKRTKEQMAMSDAAEPTDSASGFSMAETEELPF